MPSTYVDRIYGVTTSAAVKTPCTVASTSAITLSGVQTIDGVLLTAYSGPNLPADRVLVTGQADRTTNGIYLVQTTAWTREPDFDGARDAVTGTIIEVRSGTLNANTFWKLTCTDNPINIGISLLTFAQFSFYQASATSTTSLTVGTGSKSLTTNTGLNLQVGQYVQIIDTAATANYMIGQITSYNQTTGLLVVNVSGTGGSGTYATWGIFISGATGPTGPMGPSGASTSWGVAGGSADVLTVTMTPTVTVLTDGLLVGFRALSANATTTPTLQADATTAHTMTQKGGGALAAGSIIAQFAEYLARYNLANTRWELLNPTVVSANPFSDAVALIRNSADATKLAIFSAANITTATTRTVTIPDKSGTLAMTTDTIFVQRVKTAYNALATGTTSTSANDTIPQITNGTEFMTQTITPTNASNKLRITIVFMGAWNDATVSTTLALHQDATANALAAWGLSSTGGSNNPSTNTCIYEMTAGTTSATTFRVRVGMSSGGTVTFNGGVGVRRYGGVSGSLITVEELTQ